MAVAKKKTADGALRITLDFEKGLGDPVMGIDEAWRGPLAGGVYAAAVSVPIELAERLLAGEWSDINDSKKLTEKKREELARLGPCPEHRRSFGPVSQMLLPLG